MSRRSNPFSGLFLTHFLILVICLLPVNIGAQDLNFCLAKLRALNLVQLAEEHSEKILSALTLVKPVRVKLPYIMTQAYNVSLLRIDKSSPHLPEIFLSYAKKIQVIPVMGLVESWHLLIKEIEGYHFTLMFDSMEARKTFLNRIGFAVQITEGELSIDGKEKYTLALTPVQLVKAIDRISDFQEDSLKSLLLEADNVVRTATATYYFKANQVIGYMVGGVAVRVKKATEEDFASHAKILERMGVDPSSVARSSLRDDLIMATSRMNEILSSLVATQPESLRRKPITDLYTDVQLLINIMGAEPGGTALRNLMIQIMSTNLSLLRQRLQYANKDGPYASLIEDLHKLTTDHTRLKTGIPHTELFFKFLWIKNGSTTYHPLLYTTGALLHETMLSIALESELVKPARFLNYLEGGVTKIIYGNDGKIKDVEFPQSSFEVLSADTSHTVHKLLSEVDQQEIRSFLMAP